MEFGVFSVLSVPRPWELESERNVYMNALEHVRVAESLGFTNAWCLEHHFLEEYSHSSCPEMFLAACAVQTSRMRLGFGIATCVPEMSHPVRLAERAAFLDCISNGRVEFGTGRSSTWNELGGFNSNIDDTKRSWDEYVRTIPQMWTQERFRHKGYSFSMPERAVLPKPIQRPHPPMWVAVTAPGTEVDAGERGLGFLGLSYGGYEAAEARFVKYREAIADCNPVSEVVNNQIAVVNWLYCHEDHDTAVERGNGLVNRFGSAAAQTFDTRQAYPTDNYAEAGLLNKLRADPLAAWTDKAVPDGLCIGTPKALIKSLKRWEDLGVDRVLFLLQFSEMLPQQAVLDSLKLFSEEVMPEFSGTVDFVPQLQGAA